MSMIGRYSPPGQLGVDEILRATGGRLVQGRPGGRWSLCTDTREIRDGALFVALRGDVHNGHRFVREVLQQHRCGALVEESAVADGLLDAAPGDSLLVMAQGPVVAVPDTLLAFGQIAGAFLAQRELPRVGVTGSVGKTTTRAMVASILRRGAPGLETQGNFNNRIGLPLTALAPRPEHRWAVFEMGMSEPGEIRSLAAIAHPTVRVITHVAGAHLEFFPDVGAIASAKGEIFEEAAAQDALVYPLDSPWVDRFPLDGSGRALPFSLRADAACDSRLLSVEDRHLAGSRAHALVLGEELDFEVPLPGHHQVHNALCAAVAARAAGAPLSQIAAGLAAVEVPGRRMKVSHRGGVTVLDDAYNANPTSVEAALRTLVAVPAVGRRVAALGDMLELGPDAARLHGEAGTLAAELGVDWLVGAGPLMNVAVTAAAKAGAEATYAADSLQAGQLLADGLQPGDVLLLKGSRGMRMERALDALGEEEA